MNLSNLNRDVVSFYIMYSSDEKYISLGYDGEQMYKNNVLCSRINILRSGAYRKYNSDGTGTNHIFDDGTIGPM